MHAFSYYSRPFRTSFGVAVILVVIYLIWEWQFTTEVPQSTTTSSTTTTTTTTEVPEKPDPYEVFIRSAYYYPTSKSLGNNSVAFDFVANYDWVEKWGNFTIRASNKISSRINVCSIALTTPGYLCQLSNVFGTCEAIEGMEKLEIDLGEGDFYEIDFTTVSYDKKNVVTCISPLFAAEQWQYLAFATHVYKRFGTFMHLYVRSVINPVYNLIKAYETEGYMKVQTWTRFKFSSVPEYLFNPNAHVGFRNQDGVQTDCLLQYKESAEWIFFVDLDDVMVPRVAPNYMEEFAQLLGDNQYLHYGKENVYVEASLDPATFNLVDMLKTIRHQHVTETGKYATRPQLINHTMIHYPGGDTKAYKGNYLPKEINSIVHLKKLYPLGSSPEQRKLWPYDFGDKNTTIFKQEDVDEIEKDFKHFYAKYYSVWLELPKTTTYLQIFEKCYYQKYYKYWKRRRPDQITWCPNPDMCRLPVNPGIPCANTDADFFSTEKGTIINIHYQRNDRFIIEDGCVP